MRKISYMAGGSALAIVLSLGAATSAFAQEPTEVEAVIITGSLIAGTPEDAALPVDVIGAEELAKQGSPTTVELLKGLSVSNGVLGDTNQFDARAQGSEGSGSVNLRGLGPTRTLVLMNGRRLPVNPFALAGSGAVDTNIIPSAAIGRVEVLKDGAAATYGSDAIAGVVNFITRTNFEGLELSASYKGISGSDGDYTASFVYGWQGDRSNVLLSAGWQHRSELSVRERDWASLDYLENPEGGWSAAGNPSTIIPLGATTTAFRDDQCTPLGGFSGFSGITPVCYWQYNQFDNLVEKEDRFQIYGEFNVDLTDTTKLHIEGLYASTDVPEWKTSPSYALLATPTFPSSSVPGRYFVPSNNPGLMAYAAAHPGTIPGYSLVTGAATNIPTAAFAAGALVVANRPYALGGNPMFDYGASLGSRNFEAYRLSADLKGEWENGINWVFSATYGEERGNRTGYDTVVNRYALALRGFGGADCNGIQAGSPGSTCEWANPFSSSIPGNALTGQGGGTFNPALANSAALTRWFFQKLETEQTSGLFVLEGLFSGDLGWELAGGESKWAFGMQYRRATFTSSYNDFSNRAVNPCLDTPINGSTTCAAPQGPFSFLGVGSEADLKQEVKSAFGEVMLPFTDNLNATIAARYESYEGAVGSTFDPKLSVRWQVMDSFALRGSIGTTFRAPPPVSLSSDFVTSLQSVNGTFRAVDIYGNPNLSPETATTYSVGGIFEVGNFKATVDYWNFDFQDPITTDPVGAMVSNLFKNGIATGALLNCSAIYDRFTFNTPVPLTCAQRNLPGGGGAAGASSAITRVRTETVNGAGVKTSGIDVLADYTIDDFLGGTLTIGGSATYVIEYVTEATDVAGITVAPSFDAVGLLNYQTTAYPLPQKKGNIYFEYNTGPHNLRLTIRYIDGYLDQRGGYTGSGTGIFCPNTVPAPGQCTAPYKDTTGAIVAVTTGRNIDSFVTSDLTYRVFLPWDATATVSVDNMFDEDPPFARLDLNYDPFTASGLGRTWKFSLTKKF